MEDEKDYLGNCTYVKLLPGHGITLTTEYGTGKDPENEMFLGIGALKDMIRFLEEKGLINRETDSDLLVWLFTNGLIHKVETGWCFCADPHMAGPHIFLGDPPVITDETRIVVEEMLKDTTVEKTGE